MNTSDALSWSAALVLCASGAVLMTWPRWRRSNRLVGVDVWRWLKYSDVIRTEGRLPRSINRYIFPADFSYPPIFLLLLARLFNKRQAERFNWLVAPVIGAAEALAVFIVASYCFNDLRIGLVAQIFYLTNPANILESVEMNARGLGSAFLFSTTIMLSYTTGLNVNLESITIAAFGGSLILLSHRMSTQLYFIFLFVLSVKLATLTPLLIGLLSAFLALAMSLGQYMAVLKNHVSMLMFWLSERKARFVDLAGNSIPKTKVRRVVIGVFGRSPLSFCAAVTVLFTQSTSQLESVLGLFICTGVALALITSLFEIAYFLGEGYRYLALVAPASALFMASFLANHLHPNPLISTTASIGICGLFIILWRQKHVFRGNLGESFAVSGAFIQMMQKLDNCHGKNGFRFASFPPTADDAAVYFSEGATVAFHDNGVSLLKSRSIFPRLLIPIEKAIEDLNLDYVYLADSVVRYFKPSIDAGTLRKVASVDSWGLYVKNGKWPEISPSK